MADKVSERLCVAWVKFESGKNRFSCKLIRTKRRHPATRYSKNLLCMTDLINKPNSIRILLGVSGGIAAYKAADLVRRLRDADFEVRVVMTENAARFVSPLTFQALSGNPVRSSLWDAAAEAAMGHIELARWANIILIAPASADLIARLAHGMANDLISTLCLASEAPIYIAPAMNRVMWANQATQNNVSVLSQRGYVFFGPAEGEQACGEVGAGRLLEPELIVQTLTKRTAAADPDSVLSGRKIVISAGPTFEDIDPVRFIGNRSSGRMGFAIAQAAAEMGAKVILISGPVSLSTPKKVNRIDVRSALQMHAAVLQNVESADVFIGAAAVADYRPKECLEQKHKKQNQTEDWMLELIKNPDIVADVANRASPTIVVGFAAETEQVERFAQAKLKQKKLHLIVANDVSEGRGFDRPDNALQLFWNGGNMRLEQSDKLTLARALLRFISHRWFESGHNS